MVAWRALFAELQHRPQRKLLNTEWTQRVGAELIGALRKQKLLVAAGPATTYPCDRAGTGCSRRVVEQAHDGDGPPYFAYCSSTDAPGCDPLPLKEAQLASSSFDFVAWTKRLQELLDAEKVGPRDEAALAETWDLGLAPFAGLQRSIWLTLSAGLPEFLPVLAARRAALAPTLVLVLDRDLLSAEAIRDYAAGEVMVAAIGDLLDLSRTTLALSEQGLRQQAGPQTGRFCQAIDRSGVRAVSRAEYDRLVERRSELDLFLDLTRAGMKGRYRGGRRVPGEQFEEVQLEPMQATALAELVTSGKPMRLRDLGNQSARLDKTIEEGRRRLDFSPSLREWRSFHTLRADTKADKAYAFNPPTDLVYLLLRPLPG